MNNSFFASVVNKKITMPTLIFKGKKIEIDQSKTLRNQLIKHGVSPHNYAAEIINCRGIGTCGTCAIKIVDGLYTPPTRQEKWRLNFPPFKNGLQAGFRLSCQTRILSDSIAEKGIGFWGEKFYDKRTSSVG
jgi:ferredoxin